MNAGVLARIIGISLLVGLIAPLRAAPLPNPPDIVSAQERPLLPEFAQAVSEVDPAEALPILDRLLSKLAAPTHFRGLVSVARASALYSLGRTREAQPPVEEALRLLPTYSTPKLLGTAIFVAESNPQRAADLWLTASRDDPETTLFSDSFMLAALLDQLNSSGDFRRAEAIEERLVDIGYSRGSAMERSALAASVATKRAREGNIEGAKALIPSILDPMNFAWMLVDKRYEKLWLPIEAWAGSKLEKRWPGYLAELKRDWEASNDFELGIAYARALATAGDHKAVISTFLPLLQSDRLSPNMRGLEYVPAVVARSLRHEGRAQEGVELLLKYEALWPEDREERLNFPANLAREHLFSARYEEALATIDRTLAATKAFPREVNASAVAGMHRVRVCTLQQLGRAGEATESIAYITAYQRGVPSAYRGMLMCLGRTSEVRDLLLRQLEDEDQRTGALYYLQPDPTGAVTEYQKQMDAKHQALAADPELVKAVARYGRILPFAPGQSDF